MHITQFDNINLLLAYQELFADMLEEGSDGFDKTAARIWHELQSYAETNHLPFWETCSRMGLSEAEYLAFVLAVVIELGNLKNQNICFAHAMMFCGRLLEDNDGLTILLQDRLFSLLWSTKSDSLLLAQPLVVREEIARYVITGRLSETPYRKVYIPSEQSNSSDEHKAVMEDECERLRHALEDGLIVIRGEKAERESLLCRYCDMTGSSVYFVTENEPDISDCIICAVVSGSILYFEGLSAERLHLLKFWHKRANIPVIIGASDLYPPGITVFFVNERRLVTLDDIYGNALREQLELLFSEATAQNALLFFDEAD